MLQKNVLNWSIKQMKVMHDKKQSISFDLAIQRNANVWDIDKKSLLIHSYLEGFPIPPFYASATDGVYNLLDGKQRLTSTFQFINNEFCLSNIPTVTIEENGQQTEVDINGLMFSELAEDFQDTILSIMLTVYAFKDATDEQVEEIFYRLNNGVSLTKFELTRVKAGHLMDFIKEITQHDLFKKMVFTEKQILRYQNEETVLQIINLLYSDSADFTGVNISKFAEGFTLTEEQMEEIKNIATYINNTLDTVDIKTYKKFMKKAHISTIFKIVSHMFKGEHVNPEKFRNWLVSFFIDENRLEGTPYNNAVRMGSAKKENIKIRVNAITKSFERAFGKVENEEVEKEVAVTEEETEA